MASFPSQVSLLINWWLPRVQAVLGEQLLCVTVFGSAAMGDYIPHSSDLDICCILRRNMLQDEAEQIGLIHDGMRDLFIRNAVVSQAIEGYYVPLIVAMDEQAAGACFTAGGTTRKFAMGNPVAAFDRYSLAHAGQTIWGRPLQFSPPSRQSLLHDFLNALQVLADRSQWHDSQGWYGSMVCLIARSLFFWRDGLSLSKSESLRRAAETCSLPSSPFELALRRRLNGTLCQQDQLQLRSDFTRLAPTAHDLLASFAE